MTLAIMPMLNVATVFFAQAKEGVPGLLFAQLDESFYFPTLMMKCPSFLRVQL
jgi:hypothetical protein